MTELEPAGQLLAQTIEDWKAEPRSFYNLVPGYVQRAMENINEKYIGKTEKELERLLDPDPFVCRLRLSVWREFEESQSKLRKININNIALAMGCPSVTITAHLKMPHHLVWILCPPTSYDIFLDEALSYGLRRMRNEILGMDIIGPDGGVDVKKADLLLKAVAFLDMRRHGGIVQKTQNLHVYQKDFKKISADMELKDIEAKIKELEEKGTMDIARHAAPVITNESLDD